MQCILLPITISFIIINLNGCRSSSSWLLACAPSSSCLSRCAIGPSFVLFHIPLSASLAPFLRGLVAVDECVPFPFRFPISSEAIWCLPSWWLSFPPLFFFLLFPTRNTDYMWYRAFVDFVHSFLSLEHSMLLLVWRESITLACVFTDLFFTNFCWSLLTLSACLSAFFKLWRARPLFPRFFPFFFLFGSQPNRLPLSLCLSRAVLAGDGGKGENNWLCL